MEAIKPQGELEKRLIKKENWKLANDINSYWHEDSCKCDICKSTIGGRHMIDGKLANSFEFALMCPRCHKERGSGFGEGKGQLYTKLINLKWLLTFGFTDHQLGKDDEMGFGNEDDF